MDNRMNRRDFLKTSAAIGSLSALPFQAIQCNSNLPKDFLSTPGKYDIFAKYKKPQKIYRFDTLLLQQTFPDADAHKLWLLRSILSIFQGLVNRSEPRIYLKHSDRDVDWLSVYRNQGHNFEIVTINDFRQLFDLFAAEMAGYIVADPDMLHSLNVAQTWASLENWIVVTPELEPLVQKSGLAKKQDLRGRWPDRVSAYEWAFENLLPDCSKHVVGDCCVDFPYHPSPGSFHIRDFLVANRAFTVDLSAARRERKEYQLLDRIYDTMQLPAGVWGWHCARDHEHWAVHRAAIKSLYTICAAGAANFTVHGAFRPKNRSIPRQKPSPRKSKRAEKDKIYIAFMMTDGDSLWAMDKQQMWNWGLDKKRDFPVAWGFLPLLADIAPSMYIYYVENMKDTDYMVAGPSGAGYTYPHLHSNPRPFLKYSKHYMQRCGLEIAYITNWNDYTNWQEVDVPWFNAVLFNELDNCIGYLRGMGESAFEPNYNFADRPYIFCGEGIHRPDKDDVATIKTFIDANPNRPLFICVLVNVAVSMQRLQKVVDDLDGYNIDYVRLDDFMVIIKDAFKQGLVSEDLYPNRQGNERILIKEAPTQWRGTRSKIERLIPIIRAGSQQEALTLLNSPNVNLAQGQAITNEDAADVLAFELCNNMFALVKNVLNYRGIYVNQKLESIKTFHTLFARWPGIESVSQLFNLWQNWDRRRFKWQDITAIGDHFIELFQRADIFFRTQ